MGKEKIKMKRKRVLQVTLMLSFLLVVGLSVGKIITVPKATAEVVQTTLLSHTMATQAEVTNVASKYINRVGGYDSSRQVSYDSTTQAMNYTVDGKYFSSGCKYDITDLVKNLPDGTTVGISADVMTANGQSDGYIGFLYDTNTALSDDMKSTISTTAFTKITYEAQLSDYTSNVYFYIHGSGPTVYIKNVKLYYNVDDGKVVDNYMDSSDIKVSTPVVNASGTAITFNMVNKTTTDRNLIFYVKSYENGTLTAIDEYHKILKTGTAMKSITIPAKTGSMVSIYDSTGNTYIEAYHVGNMKWAATWASAQQSLDSSRSEYPPTAIDLSNNTYRQIIRISNSGSQIRLKYSNEYGTTPLVLKSVHIAKPMNIGDSVIDTSTDTVVTFQGSQTVSIPAGATVVSDAIEFNAKDVSRIAVSTYFGAVPAKVTSHTGARTVNYLTTGNHVSDISLDSATKLEYWYFLTGVDVLATNKSKAVVCFGDSITDGRGVTTNMDNRWTDILANRLQANANTSHISVLNQGIGGNSIFGGLGPAGYVRFDRDVLKQESVGYVIILIGINDIGYATSDTIVNQMIEKYKAMADQAHEKGIKVYGATITPFKKSTSYYSAQYGVQREQYRQSVNAWIRNSNGYFDAVIDFDAALRDSADPEIIAAAYDSDGLHPNAAGYKVMGDLIDLALFEDK